MRRYRPTIVRATPGPDHSNSYRVVMERDDDRGEWWHHDDAALMSDLASRNIASSMQDSLERLRMVRALRLIIDRLEGALGPGSAGLSIDELVDLACTRLRGSMQ